MILMITYNQRKKIKYYTVNFIIAPLIKDTTKIHTEIGTHIQTHTCSSFGECP